MVRQVQRLQILHDHTQPPHPEPISHALHLRRAVLACTVVETLLSLTPIATHGQVRTEKRRVDTAEVTFGDVGFEDIRPYEEDVAQLADELKAFVQSGDSESCDSVLVGFEIPKQRI